MMFLTQLAARVSMKDVIRIGNSKFWTDNGVLYCEFKRGEFNYNLETEEIEVFVKVIDKLCKGKSMPFLIDLRDAQGVLTRESASLLANSPILNKLRISEAYVINSMRVRLVITSYKRIYEPATPFVVFDNIESAKEYCLQAKRDFYKNN